MAKKLKLKFDFLSTAEFSPHLIDLKKKGKKTSKNNRKKFFIFLFLLFSATIFLFFLISSVYFQAIDLKKNLQLVETVNLEIFSSAIQSFKNLDFNEAANLFTLSQQKFSDSSQKIEQTNFLLKNIIKLVPRYATGFYLIQSFEKASKIGFNLAETAGKIKPFLNKIGQSEQTRENEILPAGLKEVDFLKISQSLKEKSLVILKLVNCLNFSLRKVETRFVPEKFQEPLKILQSELPKVEEDFQQIYSFLENFEKLVGQDQLKRYLILFQNNTEIRPTGGFLGTFALIDFDRGKIKNFEMPAGGTYSLRSGLSVNVLPPKQLFVAQLPWQFHDANWFADFPTSAKKLAWFYENSGGSSIDGLIALNFELFPLILEKIGPLEFIDYQKVLTAENFNLEIRKAIEGRKEWTKPRQFLVDLTPVLIKSILRQESEKIFAIANLIKEGLEKKQIQFYFFEPSVQEFFAVNNLDGRIKETLKDYLLVVAINVNGAKTEGVIEQNIFYQTELQIDGSLISTLKIQRKHHGQPEQFIVGKTDLSYLKVYLPKGSVFLGAQGFVKKEMTKKLEEKLVPDEDLLRIEKEISIDELSGTRITEEFGKTCFSNFLELNPGETKEASFKYLLPFKLNLRQQKSTSYSLLVQKQSGRESNFNFEINFPEVPQILWQYPLEIKQAKEYLTYSTLLDRDKFIGLILK